MNVGIFSNTFYLSLSKNGFKFPRWVKSLKVAVFSLSLVEDESSSSEDVEEIEEEVSTTSLQDSGMRQLSM